MSWVNAGLGLACGLRFELLVDDIIGIITLVNHIHLGLDSSNFPSAKGGLTTFVCHFEFFPGLPDQLL